MNTTNDAVTMADVERRPALATPGLTAPQSEAMAFMADSFVEGRCFSFDHAWRLHVSISRESDRLDREHALYVRDALQLAGFAVPVRAVSPMGKSCAAVLGGYAGTHDPSGTGRDEDGAPS